MIPFFVCYALLVWFPIVRWRRRWQAFVVLAAGIAGLLLISWFHWKLGIWTHGHIRIEMLQALMYPYTALVAMVGLFIACLPRPEPRGRRDGLCHACGYNLAGLSLAPGAPCPECGTPRLPAPPVPRVNPIELEQRRKWVDEAERNDAMEPPHASGGQER